MTAPALTTEGQGLATTLCLRPENELPGLAHNCITYRDGAKVDVVWTRYQFAEICWLLLNGNDFKFFLLVWQDAEGNARFAKNKLARADRRAEWAWNTITGRAKRPVGIGFFPTNLRGESRWGAMDFDAHRDADRERARDLAFAAFRVIERHCQHRLLLGTSGPGGGWHLFVFADRFYRVEEWIRFLEEVALRIGAPLEKGVCEIFPSSARGHHGGGGIRCPGSYNPKTGDFGHLFLDSVTPALGEKREEIVSFLFLATTREKKAQLHDKSQKPAFELDGGLAISAAGTRHKQLKKLVGETFRSHGRETTRQLARRQYETAAPRPRATLEEHLAEFEELWAFFLDLWRGELRAPERQLFEALTTPNEKDAFRIMHGWSKLAAGKDFAVSCERLGCLIGITWQAISKMRSKFESLGIIGLTAHAKKNISSARYRWLPTATSGD